MIWLMIGLLGTLIILSILTILNNKKKVVYLKPKNNTNPGNGDAEGNNNANTQRVSPPPQYATTSAPMDEGVLQSEIRTQRQSAVAMSAGQKEGATQIIKDWLDESKNEEEQSEE